MTIQAFADNHRLKVSRDECGEAIIAGRLGQIYEFSDREMGVMFLDPEGKWQPKTWGNRRRAAEAIGMVTRQNGDTEGCLSFDPANKKQVAMAIRIAKVRPKRVISPEQAAAGAARLAAARQNRSEPLENGA